MVLARAVVVRIIRKAEQRNRFGLDLMAKTQAGDVDVHALCLGQRAGNAVEIGLPLRFRELREGRP